MLHPGGHVGRLIQKAEVLVLVEIWLSTNASWAFASGGILPPDGGNVLQCLTILGPLTPRASQLTGPPCGAQ
jgi:hypothetical protein